MRKIVHLSNRVNEIAIVQRNTPASCNWHRDFAPEDAGIEYGSLYYTTMAPVRAILVTVIPGILDLILSGVTFGGLRAGPRPVPDPRQGDGAVSTFYVWEKEVPATPGLVLRYEPLPDALMLTNATRGWRILYTSINGLDGTTSVAVSGTVYFPKGTAPAGGWPVVAWAHGFAGVADVCAPSWTPRRKRDTDYLNRWLNEGFAIVATDYQGLGTPGGHAWGVPRMEAYSVIDSVRAARMAFRVLSDQVVLVGQSQGARAVLSASALAPEYAPEFRFKGTIATGVPAGPAFAPRTKAPQIPVPKRMGGVHARLAVYSLFRLLAIDSGFDPLEYLSDIAKPSFETARTSCTAAVDDVNAKNGVTVENALKQIPNAASQKAAPYQRYPLLSLRTRYSSGQG